ncbi:c-type cytochrome [Phytohalomonas tamaricis]|uniref:c-type cytochrome n=1 Tax=Phytohalomonas tamaricis TaxID=2081032 RepID=UPI000D0B0702|nr:cytochrome c [Phytohalomonas tamaricis]
MNTQRYSSLLSRSRLFGLVGGMLSLWAAAVLPAQAQDAEQSQIERGEYLARAGDCVACHITEGGKPFAGGLAFELPFGTLYSPNITPDKETGIGDWSDDDFVNAMQKGVGKDGKHYYPAFPYTSYTLMPREDILAIKAYLFSLEPVHQPNRDNDIGFPFNQRWGMMFWNWMFNDNERFKPDPEQSAEWNRGAYLVEGLGHCGECHTPRNLFQARDSSKALAGAEIQGWKAWNITSDDEHGIGAWPDEALASYLSAGHAEGYGVAGGPMAEVVNHSLRFLTPEDINAMVVYLKSVEPQSEGIKRPPLKQLEASVPQQTDHPLGRKLFADTCVSCHSWDGNGRQTPYAALKGLRTVHDPEALNLIQILLDGDALHTANGNYVMPSFGEAYSNEELAELSNFVLEHFGEVEGQLDAKTVEERRQAP